MAVRKGRFSKNQRLGKPSEFRSVFQAKNRSVNHCFLVIARPNGRRYPRLGLAISRKKLPKAVSRNLVKRLVRESFRVNSDLLSGLDVVVVAQEKIDVSQKKQLARSLHTHWRKVSGCARS